MPSRLSNVFALFFFTSSLIVPPWAAAQVAKTSPGGEQFALDGYVATPSVPGYESELAAEIRERLGFAHPATDNLGDVVVTFGAGYPHRLIVTPLDEPGFVVSGITDDGYLRVQRLPQFRLPSIFNQLYTAQPVRVRTNSGKWIDGVVAGLSVHLQPGRADAPKSGDLENMYIDIGATSAAEVHKAGVDILAPIVLDRRMMDLDGAEFAGASVGDRFGVEAVAETVEAARGAKINGTLTFAFVVQQLTGARGLQRILTTIPADEMVYVGPLLPGGPVEGVKNMHRAPRREPGSGVLIGLESTNGTLSGLAFNLQQTAESAKIPVATDFSAGILPLGYLPLPALPAQWAHLGVAVAWPGTPVQEISSADLDQLTSLLELYAVGEKHSSPSSAAQRAVEAAVSPVGKPLPMTELLRRLTQTYGVSDHESAVREEVMRLLPAWAKPDTDDAGNLILQLGVAPAGTKSPSLLFVAHLDEIGFTVKSISDDGRLEVSSDGGEDLSFYLGHPALVHSSNGDHDAIMELPVNWDRPDFTWPEGDSPAAIRVDVGARTHDEAAKLGIQPGDTVTIPKEYHSLLGARANARSFDDRVGDASLISAVWALGGPLHDRDVTFVWSTGEELGLVGASKLAKRLSTEGREPDYVFAIDTFVSSDSPLESKRFADARLGDGFVVRAIDNSNIVPPGLVEKVLKLARASRIPAQYGVTGGGNDGAAFTRYGSVDVALGWPLRYSHSPAEVIDTHDADALARILAVIAKTW
ncbi:MAG TPA: M20/M25/M40 family metallo-hydrolase [Verrucomicrobiae bacterium]|nr:M20/M25/M40 family metallo-hydrolase [Verrucomicrobiae bacterium]